MSFNTMTVKRKLMFAFGGVSALVLIIGGLEFPGFSGV